MIPASHESRIFFSSGLSDFLFLFLSERMVHRTLVVGFIVVGNTLTFKPSFSSQAAAPVKNARHGSNSTRFFLPWM
jgi:hypothetical protein